MRCPRVFFFFCKIQQNLRFPIPPNRDASAILCAGVAMLKFLFPWRRKTRPSNRPHSSAASRSSQSDFSDRSTAEEVGAVPFRHNRSFSVEDLKAATRNFHRENLLGAGGFGSVYKGILDDGTLVAVKKLSVRSKQGTNEFINEVKLLSTVQHRNLVRLYGCCTEGDERMLVYEYLRNKSLDLALFEGGDLEWSVRRTIVLGAAKALAYLHEGSRCRIIHRDIKASNILLDDKFQAKIADFGLAKLFNMEQTHASTRVAGSFGYLAPEYVVNGKLTDKADVYSFGMVILEVVSGRRITDFRLSDRDQRLVEVAWRLYNRDNLMALVDRKLGDRYVPWEAARLIHVALLCTQANPDLRPAMSRVVYLLNGRSPISDQPTKPPLIRGESPKRQLRLKGYEGSPSGTSGSSTVASASSFFSQ